MRLLYDKTPCHLDPTKLAWRTQMSLIIDKADKKLGNDALGDLLRQELQQLTPLLDGVAPYSVLVNFKRCFEILYESNVTGIAPYRTAQLFVKGNSYHHLWRGGVQDDLLTMLRRLCPCPGIDHVACPIRSPKKIALCSAHRGIVYTFSSPSGRSNWEAHYAQYDIPFLCEGENPQKEEASMILPHNAVRSFVAIHKVKLMEDFFVDRMNVCPILGPPKDKRQVNTKVQERVANSFKVMDHCYKLQVMQTARGHQDVQKELKISELDELCQMGKAQTRLISGCVLEEDLDDSEDNMEVEANEHEERKKAGYKRIEINTSSAGELSELYCSSRMEIVVRGVINNGSAYRSSATRPEIVLGTAVLALLYYPKPCTAEDISHNEYCNKKKNFAEIEPEI